MNSKPADISIDRLLEQDIPELVGFHRDIVMVSDFGKLHVFSHPARLRATTVLVCLSGVIECSINLRHFCVRENQMLVNFAGDIIHIHRAENVSGYAVLISEDYLQQLQIDFRLRMQSYVSLRDNGPITVPLGELSYLKPYYVLFKKNMEDGNPEVIKGLVLALSFTILSLVRRFGNTPLPEPESGESRARSLFDRFMRLLGAYHTKERSLTFYADMMCLSPKYVSAMIKAYSGKAALEWINEYVVLEAKMMLRYTDMRVQEIAYALNFTTQSAFGKYFRQQTGVSPRHYRMTK